MSSDEELLKRFAGGDRNALGELAVRYEIALLNLAWPMLGSRELAMDVVQETWLRVIRYAGTFNGNSTVKTWLYRIAINQCRSARAARSLTLAPLVSDEEPDAPNAAACALDGADPPAEAMKEEQHHLLKSAVEKLGPELQEVILLCYTQGLTHPEAAEALEIPVGTVKSRIHKALEHLRRRVLP